MLLNLAWYIMSDFRYNPPTLAISAHYWKAWVILLIIAAFNPAKFGKYLVLDLSFITRNLSLNLISFVLIKRYIILASLVVLHLDMFYSISVY